MKTSSALEGGQAQVRGSRAARQPAAATSAPDRTVKKLSVLLPADLHRRARRHALLHDKTLTTLIIELLTQVLDDPEVKPPAS